MKLKALLLTAGMLLSGVVGILAVPGVAYAVACPAGTARNPNGDGGEAPTFADCNLPATLPTKTVPETAQVIINVAVSVVGIIAVAVIVIGGILYVTSVGDAAKAKRAQHTIIYGIVGLIIALLAYAIVNFVLKSVFV